MPLLKESAPASIMFSTDTAVNALLGLLATNINFQFWEASPAWAFRWSCSPVACAWIDACDNQGAMMCFNDVTCGKNWNDTWYDDIIQSWLVCKYRNMARDGPYCVVTSGQALAAASLSSRRKSSPSFRNVPRMPIIFNSSLWIQRMATGNEALRRAVIASKRGTIQLGDNVLPVMDAICHAVTSRFIPVLLLSRQLRQQPQTNSDQVSTRSNV